MKLYLVRHGQALPERVDPQRSLSEPGEEGVRCVAAFLAPLGLRVGRVLHSGKRRAQQTAELLADAIGAARNIEPVPGLKPMDDVEPFAYAVNGWSEDTMVVGHLPFLEKLLSRLVTGNQDCPAVLFLPGTIACLGSDEDGTWSIMWVIGPELLMGRGRDDA
jgi:phosphohistidine phosphatase